MIDINRYIEDISEENIMYFLKLDKNINITYGNYNEFIKILKNDYTCTQYICKADYEKAIIFLQKLINCFKLENINIIKLYEIIKTNGSFELLRVSDWEKTDINLINIENITFNIVCNYSFFKHINKWGFETKEEKYKLFNFENNVIWINKFNFEPDFFILYKKEIIGISYKHKLLKIFKNLKNNYNLRINNEIILDNIIKKDNVHIKQFEIDLSENIYKGFFYKGLLYDCNWKNEISILKDITFTNGLLKIIIENSTYPHMGYFLLDINEYKIVDAKKI